MISFDHFRKSSFSAQGSCVEVCRRPDGMIAIRDSKDISVPEHHFTPAEWTAFLAGVRNGEFDLP
jgi:GTP cyclohydrolase I